MILYINLTELQARLRVAYCWKSGWRQVSYHREQQFSIGRKATHAGNEEWLNIQYPTRNVQFPRGESTVEQAIFPSSLDIPCWILDIQPFPVRPSPLERQYQTHTQSSLCLRAFVCPGYFPVTHPLMWIGRSNSHYVGQTSGLPVAVPLAPQGAETSSAGRSAFSPSLLKMRIAGLGDRWLYAARNLG